MKRTPEQDQYVTDVLGIDVAKILATLAPPADHADADDDDFDPPPAPAGAGSTSVQPGAPGTEPPTPPTPAEKAWTDAGDKVKKTDKRIAALKVLGSDAEADFRKRFDAIKSSASDGKQIDAVKALDILVKEVDAEFDKQRAPPVPTAEQLKARKEVAKRRTSVEGHGTDSDAALVVEQLAKMPKALLDALEKNGTKVKVCRGSVTDYLTELKGVKPRGWPPGATWDNVPGLQQPGKKEVVIAT